MREFPFSNTTGGTIPAGAAMVPTGVDADGFLLVAQPTADSSMFVVFNAAVDVANNAKGVAFGWDGGVVPVGVNSADEPYTAADTFGTAAGDWKLRKGKKGFRLPTASVQGIANAVPDPAGTTPANWSATVTGLMTAAAQTGGGRKKLVTGTDASKPGWDAEKPYVLGEGYTVPWVVFSGLYTDFTAPGDNSTVAIDVVPVGTVTGVAVNSHGAVLRMDPGTGAKYPSLTLAHLPGASPNTAVVAGSIAGQAASSVTSWAVFRGFAVVVGQDITVAGLVFTGGLKTGGTLSVPAASVTGLAAVATSGQYADLAGAPALAAVATTGDYADIVGTKPPATTTVALSYNSGTKDLTVTVNGVSDTVNLT